MRGVNLDDIEAGGDRAARRCDPEINHGRHFTDCNCARNRVPLTHWNGAWSDRLPRLLVACFDVLRR